MECKHALCNWPQSLAAYTDDGLNQTTTSVSATRDDRQLIRLVHHIFQNSALMSPDKAHFNHGCVTDQPTCSYNFRSPS